MKLLDDVLLVVVAVLFGTECEVTRSDVGTRKVLNIAMDFLNTRKNCSDLSEIKMDRN